MIETWLAITLVAVLVLVGVVLYMIRGVAAQSRADRVAVADLFKELSSMRRSVEATFSAREREIAQLRTEMHAQDKEYLLSALVKPDEHDVALELLGRLPLSKDDVLRIAQAGAHFQKHLLWVLARQDCDGAVIDYVVDHLSVNELGKAIAHPNCTPSARDKAAERLGEAARQKQERDDSDSDREVDDGCSTCDWQDGCSRNWHNSR